VATYYKIVNLTKREYLNPGHMGCSHAYGGFVADTETTRITRALYKMLTAYWGCWADGSDARSHWLEGRWVGDRIAFTSDGDHGGLAWPLDEPESLYDTADGVLVPFRDVSQEASYCLLHDHKWSEAYSTGKGIPCCLGCGTIPVGDLVGYVRSAPELGVRDGRIEYEIVTLASGIDVVRLKPNDPPEPLFENA
jgi:hypothetical protein